MNNLTRLLVALVLLDLWMFWLSNQPSSSSVGNPGPGLMFLLLLPVIGAVLLVWLRRASEEVGARKNTKNE